MIRELKNIKVVLNKLNISGFRGVVGEEVNPDSLLLVIDAYLYSFNPGIIALGRDTRNSSKPIAQLIKSYLILKGVNVVDFEILPTPTLLFNVKTLKLDGGIMITASHNPIQYNALKFIKRGGFFLNKNDIDIMKINLKKIQNDIDEKQINTENGKNYIFSNYKNIGQEIKNNNGVENHINRINKVFNLDFIRQKKISIALDLCNGTAIYAIPRLLDYCGLKYSSIFDDPVKAFERIPEPTIQTLQALSKFMQDEPFDIGFAFDPDADRIVTLLKNGKLISEEFTLVFAYYYYAKYLGTDNAVVNLSTSSIINNIAKEFNREILYAPVGEINVTEKMKSFNIEFGGEGNGGIIFLPVSNSRDTLTGISFILSLLAKEPDSLYNIVEKYKNIKMIKDKINIDSIMSSEIVFNNDFKKGYYKKLELLIKENFKNIKNISNIDGIRVDFDIGFLHIRFSNTEPILRIIVEKEDQNQVLMIKENAKDLIKKIKM